MADELNMPEDKIEDAFKATRRHVSVDAPINDDEGNSLLDVIASDEGAEADNELDCIRRDLRLYPGTF